MTIFSEVWNAQVTETECKMLGVERSCMESANKAPYLWTARVWKVHVKFRQLTGNIMRLNANKRATVSEILSYTYTDLLLKFAPSYDNSTR